MRFTVLVLCAVLAASCGRYDRDPELSGTTSVNFRAAPASGQALNVFEDFAFVGRILNGALFNQGEGDLIETFSSVAGGLMVFAANAGNHALGGSRFLSGAGAGASLNWIIPNGDYRFYLVGYSAASMGGTPACAAANGGNSLRLGGGTFTVAMTAGACNGPPFVDGGTAPGGPIAVSGFEVLGCTNIADLSVLAYSSGYGGSCNVDVIDKAMVKLVEWDHFDAPRPPPFNGPGINTGCIDVYPTTNAFTAYVPVQGGANAAMPIGTVLGLFGAAGCADGDLVRGFFLEGGLAAPANSGAFPAATQLIAPGGPQPPRADLGRWIFDGTATARLYMKAP